MSDEVEITNHRADATQNGSLIGIARMGADAFGYTAELRIDRGLAQLLRLRVSQLNNCSYCLNLHYEAARDAGIPRAKIDTLTAWWETDLHSEAEQAALRYAEALTRAPDTDAGQAFQRFHDALAKHFDPEKILEIIGVVVKMNVWTRLKLAEGAKPGRAELASVLDGAGRHQRRAHALERPLLGHRRRRGRRHGEEAAGDDRRRALRQTDRQDRRCWPGGCHILVTQINRAR